MDFIRYTVNYEKNMPIVLLCFLVLLAFFVGAFLYLNSLYEPLKQKSYEDAESNICKMIFYNHPKIAKYLLVYLSKDADAPKLARYAALLQLGGTSYCDDVYIDDKWKNFNRDMNEPCLKAALGRLLMTKYRDDSIAKRFAFELLHESLRSPMEEFIVDQTHKNLLFGYTHPSSFMYLISKLEKSINDRKRFITYYSMLDLIIDSDMVKKYRNECPNIFYSDSGDIPFEKKFISPVQNKKIVDEFLYLWKNEINSNE